jgi:undecaprenyl pyrophosphate phosphatase UppP
MEKGMNLPDILMDIKALAVVFAFRLLSFGLQFPDFSLKRRGQTTVEYLLMLAVVAAMALIMGILFHKRILGGMFSLVGMVIGAGKPTP